MFHLWYEEAWLPGCELCALLPRSQTFRYWYSVLICVLQLLEMGNVIVFPVPSLHQL